jgi:hypothetical protein
MNTRFLDNIFFMLRYVIQYPHFELLLEESAVNSASLINIYADFISFTSLATFADTTFLSEGPAVRVKTATNFCVITQRLCYCIHIIRKKLLRQGKLDGNLAPFQTFESSIWPANLRKNAIIQMKDWYETITKSSTSTTFTPRASVPFSPKGLSIIHVPDPVEPRKINNLKTKLLVKIGLAMEKVMELGCVFTSNPLPIGLLPWLATLQGEGFKVFTPELLLSFEDALGTTLASSYSSQGSIPTSFCDAIFELLLPRLDDGPHVYLFGNSRRMSFAESFLSATHSLPPIDPRELKEASFIYPEIKQEDVFKLKQHVGSLLFYGLYNLLHTNIEIRNKSLIFIQELIQKFNPDEENVDVQNQMLPFIGGFYSGVGAVLKQKILELSTICSELFDAHNGSFLWEAVRCARSLQLSDTKQLLVDPRSWIIELMIPWCQFVDLGAINVDMVNAEFFRFLMDSAFDDPLHNDDIVNCWGEVAKSPEYGAVNAAVLMDVVIGVCARFPNLENAAFTMASTLAKIQPDLVATVLTYHLSSAAFPWIQSRSNQSFQHTSQLAIKDYITSLHQNFNSFPPESQNDYRINCQSAAAISAILLPQQFPAFTPYLALLINYLLIHLNGSLRGSVYQNLLSGLINGLISFLHQSGEVISEKYKKMEHHLRKILGWLQMDNPKIVWAKSKDLPTNGFQVTEIPMDEFAERLITLFETHNPLVRMDLIEEVINWAAEGFLVDLFNLGTC